MAKDVVWMGTSLEDLKDLPKEVRLEVGHALRDAHDGGKAHNAKPFKGEGYGEEEVKFTRSSGNVFADLGLDNPEELLQKSYFVSTIDMVIKRRRLTQVKAAEVMGVSQPDLSKLLRWRTTGFSIDRLLSMLVALGVSPHISFEIPAKFGRPGRVVMDGLPKDERELQRI